VKWLLDVISVFSIVISFVQKRLKGFWPCDHFLKIWKIEKNRMMLIYIYIHIRAESNAKFIEIMLRTNTFLNSLISEANMTCTS
jgi:hypothetical protein